MRESTNILSDNDSTAAFDCEGLSFEQEIDLSKKILAGETAKRKLSENDALPENERESLNDAINDGDRAYEQLVLANMPRAMKTALATWRKNPYGRNDINDYHQTAMKVICMCARTYDWRMGCRFGTYVHKSLKNEMMRENARTGYALRIPEEELCRLNTLRRQKDNGEINDLADKARKSAEKLLLSCSSSKSLEEPLNNEEADTEFGETIADPTAVTAQMIEEEITNCLQISQLKDALAALPEDEQVLLKGRMGFDGEPLPLKAFVGIYAKSISGVQKKQQAAEQHLKEIFSSLPEGRLDFLITLLFPVPVSCFCSPLKMRLRSQKYFT